MYTGINKCVTYQYIIGMQIARQYFTTMHHKFSKVLNNARLSTSSSYAKLNNNIKTVNARRQ